MLKIQYKEFHCKLLSLKEIEYNKNNNIKLPKEITTAVSKQMAKFCRENSITKSMIISWEIRELYEGRTYGILVWEGEEINK